MTSVCDRQQAVQSGFPLLVHDKQHVTFTRESSITKIAFACELLFILIHNSFNFFLIFS